MSTLRQNFDDLMETKEAARSPKVLPQVTSVLLLKEYYPHLYKPEDPFKAPTAHEKARAMAETMEPDEKEIHQAIKFLQQFRKQFGAKGEGTADELLRKMLDIGDWHFAYNNPELH